MTLARHQLSGKTHTVRYLVACKSEAMKSRFELDRTFEDHASEAQAATKFIHSDAIEPRYVDPESLGLDTYDASERSFAISLNESAAKSFVVEEYPSVSDADIGENEGTLSDTKKTEDTSGEAIVIPTSKQDGSLEFSHHELNQAELDSVPWRQEVSARLTKYQARRRVRQPRYPSLQLKFESQETWCPTPPEESCSGPVSNSSAVAKSTPATNTAPLAIPTPPSPTQSSSRLIEFPRSLTVVPSHSEELAEPVFVRPRIMEAPELVPDAPALGGILIEPVVAPVYEKRPGFEMPLRAARMARRIAATLMDAVIVMTGLAMFGYIFSRVTASVPPIRAVAPILLVVAASLWAAYQYLLLVYCGTTPGLKLARLKLSHFDGSPVPRRMRRWRVLAATLSGLSLGLGYVWSFLDEDQLCWHDRITRTYIAPNS